ncbi:hypothetical protein ACFY1P_29650 [Streptomyces sp. NPDC001407]|uniref:hypothetical protein n=1 Tax=unclassified Streptomyces TaxID=2593676 RepID=UPI0036964EE7
MGTIHQEIALALLDEFVDSPSALAALMDVRRRVIRGEFDHDYVATIGSSARIKPHKWPLEQYAAFMQIHAEIMCGALGRVDIDTGGRPGPDADREGNALKLKETHPPFEAELDMEQHGADMDGVLRWREPIQVEKSTGAHHQTCDCGNDVFSPVVALRKRGAAWAPLEVGDSWPSRTLLHLREFGAVARWPYGTETITLIIAMTGRAAVATGLG